MAFTYSPTDLSSTVSTASRLAQIRWLAGQTSSSDDVVIDDLEIKFASGQRSNLHLAASLVCDSIANQYRRFPQQESVGQTNVTWGERAEFFAARALDLERQAFRFTGVAPFAGGISQTDKDTREDDSDRVFPFVKLGDFDHRGTESTSST